MGSDISTIMILRFHCFVVFQHQFACIKYTFAWIMKCVVSLPTHIPFHEKKPMKKGPTSLKL